MQKKETVQKSSLHKSFMKADLQKESKKVRDFITDGILAYGVSVGRFKFQKERKIVYAISDFPHVGASDVLMYYQISKEDYGRLLKLSHPNEIPDPEISSEITEACRKDFLCGESAYCKRNTFTLEDTDRSLAESF
ncbi:MAG: hypothetical protein IJL85_03385 [Erysipelotrichaceae bacterium]|nr:hypothetical protein [Erysipelotrichaceae bacterium]